MKNHLFLLGAIVAEVVATSALKASEGFRGWVVRGRFLGQSKGRPLHAFVPGRPVVSPGAAFSR